MRQRLFYYNPLLWIVVLIIITCSCSGEHPNEFIMSVKLNDTIFQEDVSGKLIFLFDQDTSSSLVYGVNPYAPHPVFTYDLEEWNPTDTLFIDRFTDEWYMPFSELEGEYAYRVLFDQDTTKRSSFVEKGNGYSEKQSIIFLEGQDNQVSADINQVFKGWVFAETEHIHEEQFRSEALSDFWGYDMYVESAVLLPEDYEMSHKEYPLVFVFPGFGSNHASITYGTGQIDRYGMNTVGEEKIFVFMNAEFFQGYHHFADSENNGPWGKAFTEEFLPYIEGRYRVKKQASQRFLMGQSSGAWTAVWLQVSYLELFGGAFAASPDPLDFRAHAFDIYLPNSNFYYPPDPDSASVEEGNQKKLYVELEHLLGEFGQVRTWEASFSPRNQDGTIAQLFDRNTGQINPVVANHWQLYDISKMIAMNPGKYQEHLSGKLHIFVAKDDPYGLANSVELIEEVLDENRIAADIQFFTGLGHNVWTDELRRHIHSSIENR
jgi:hypothetical protein